MFFLLPYSCYLHDYVVTEDGNIGFILLGRISIQTSVAKP